MLGKMEEIHNRVWYMRKGGGSRTCKRSIGGIWEKNGCGSKKVREVRHGGGKRL